MTTQQVGRGLRRDEEDVAVAHLERAVAILVAKIRALADQVEREARHNVKDARDQVRPYMTYGRAAGQIVHEVSWGMANINLARVIDAAVDADAVQADKRLGQSEPKAALTAMLDVAAGWAQTAFENDQAMDRNDLQGADEQPFYLSDIRRMVNDAAREVGIPEVWEEKP